jgi:hypothetical protein
LEEALLKPQEPNEKLKEAAKRYSEKVRENHTHIEDFDVEVKVEKPSIFPKEVEYDEEYTRPVYTDEFSDEKIKQKLALIEMMENDQKLGLYNEPFDNPMIKEVVPALSDEEVNEMVLNEWERKDEDDFSDLDVTLMDGLEEEENNFQEEPTEEEIQLNFSTIEPETENIFQEDNGWTPELEEQYWEEESKEHVPPIEDEVEESFDISVNVVSDEPIYQSENKEIDDINKIMEDAMSLINVPPLIEEVQVSNDWIEPTPEIPSQDEEELKKKVQES